MSKSEVYTFFPTPVRVFRDFVTEAEREEVLNLEGPVIQNWTDLELWHTQDTLPYFEKYMPRIQEACKELSVDLFCEELEWIVTNMWMNIGFPRAAHHKHNHCNAFISGIIYIDNVVTHTRFYRPQQTIGFQLVNVVDFVSNIFNADYAQIETMKEGDMILFPSYLQHDVDPNPTNKKRITLAFNAIPKRLTAQGYTLSLDK